VTAKRLDPLSWAIEAQCRATSLATSSSTPHKPALRYPDHPTSAVTRRSTVCSGRVQCVAGSQLCACGANMITMTLSITGGVPASAGAALARASGGVNSPSSGPPPRQHGGSDRHDRDAGQDTADRDPPGSAEDARGKHRRQQAAGSRQQARQATLASPVRLVGRVRRSRSLTVIGFSLGRGQRTAAGSRSWWRRR
jgi:hypothetical protein